MKGKRPCGINAVLLHVVCKRRFSYQVVALAKKARFAELLLITGRSNTQLVFVVGNGIVQKLPGCYTEGEYQQ